MEVLRNFFIVVRAEEVVDGTQLGQLEEMVEIMELAAVAEGVL
jgi:hypothetical protein